VIGYGALAALFSAVAFEFGPFLHGQTNCCTVGTMTSAFLPLAFLGVELSLRAKAWRLRLAAWVLAGIAISQMSAAWLGQGIINALVLVAAWVAFRTLITPPDRGWDMRTRLVRMVSTGPAVLAIGLLMAAAGILPRLAANAESINPGGTYDNVSQTGAARIHTLASAIETIMSDAHSYRGTSVWGTVVILMLLSLFLIRRGSVIPFFAAGAVVIPALAMSAPLISDLFYLLPRYEDIHRHSPGRVFWLYSFIAAMLAGGAVNELRRLPFMRNKWLIAVAPLVVVSIATSHMERQQGRDAGSWLWNAAGLTTVLVLVIVASSLLMDNEKRIRVIQGAVAGLVGLAFLLPNGIDLVNTIRRDDPPPGRLALWANDPWMQDLIHESLRQDDPGGVGEFLQRQQETQPPFRFIAYGGMYHPDTIRRSYPDRRLEPGIVAILQNSRAMRLRLETTQGYNPLQPLVYQEFITALNQGGQDYHYANLLYTGVSSPLLDLLNVRYVVVDRSIPEDRDDHRALAENRIEVYRDKHAIVYENPSTLPRAWMVYDVRPGMNQVGLAQLASGEVNGGEVAFVNGELPSVAPPADGAAPQVTVTRWSPDAMTLDVSHSGLGLLVVSEVYSENWKATVDGEAVEVLQTDHALLGIPVGPGQHTLEIRYDPDSLTVGLWISGITWAASIVVLAYAGWVGLARTQRRFPWLGKTTDGRGAVLLPSGGAHPARDG
jgi:hypothetical protein